MAQQQRMTGVATAAALALLMAALVMAVTAQPLPQSGGSDVGLVDPLRYLLVQRLLEARMPEAAGPVRKRTCLINAGLSHGCDYKDLVGAMEESNYWNSAMSPGRRRRSVAMPADVAAAAVAAASEEQQALGSSENIANLQHVSGSQAVVDSAAQSVLSFKDANSMQRALNRISRSLHTQ